MSGPVRKDDPTLPPPWQALQGTPRAAAGFCNRKLIAPVGCAPPAANGYTYYWNPSTNVTQYERPAGAAPPAYAPPPPHVRALSGVWRPPELCACLLCADASPRRSSARRPTAAAVATEVAAATVAAGAMRRCVCRLRSRVRKP